MYVKCILLLPFCLVFTSIVHADIKNGYAPDMPAARECLRVLNQRLIENVHLSYAERRRIQVAVRKHLQLIAHHHLTEALLRQMQLISPEMYDELDRLTDKRGRLTDIYVRFIPKEMSSVQLSGASFFQASPCDEDANQSRFGAFTVSIDIWIGETALHLLAHELGHTRYIVPNLAAYRLYYRETYRGAVASMRVGHDARDASGKMALEYGHQFLRDRRRFRKSTGMPPRHVVAIMKDVKEGMRGAIDGESYESIASSGSLK